MSLSRIKINSVLAAAFFFAVTLMFLFTVQAEEEAIVKTVDVIGTARIYGDGVPTAKNQAISNSLISAVAQVTADLLPADSMVRDFQVLNEVLYGRIGEFVRDYKVLTSSISGKEYRVMVQVTVLKGKIEQQLSDVGIIMGKKEMPRVLFLITEQTLEGQAPKGWERDDTGFIRPISEKAMAETMKTKGFSIIDYGDMVRFTEGRPQPHETELDNPAAINIGLRFQADIVIVGKSVAYKTSNIMGENIRSFKGVVSARALRTGTGEEIAVTTQTAITTSADEMVGGREALTSAGSLAGEDLAFQITASWKKVKKTPELVEIIVEGTGVLSNFVKFRKVIRDMDGVEGIQIKEMKSDEAIMLVNYKGSAKALADTLMLKSFDSFSINIYEVSAMRLRIELMSEQGVQTEKKK